DGDQEPVQAHEPVEHGGEYTASRSIGTLDAFLAPVRERIDTWRGGHLPFSRAVGIDHKELELTPPTDAPMEHDLTPVGRPRGRQVGDGVVGQLHLPCAVSIHHANLEVRATAPAHENQTRAVW